MRRRSLSDKGNDFIAGNDIALYGEKIIVSPLKQLNLECYLSTYKSASAFSKVYERMPDFWKTQRKWIEDYAAGEKGAKERYLITEKASLKGCGYIELNYDNQKMPEVDIAVLEEYQRKGYAFEAAKMLLQYVLEKETVECIIWNAFASNIASSRLAEKLGGVVVKGKNLIVEAMHEAGFQMDSVDDKEIPKMVTYEIGRHR